MKNAWLQNISPFRLAAGTAILALVWAVGFTPAPAMAQGSDAQRQACTPDAMRLCSAFIPDVAKVTACMSRKRASLSAACRATMTVSHARRASRRQYR